MQQHQYNCTVMWTGNLGTGTSSYQAYSRSYQIHAAKKAVIEASSDPKYRGDAHKYNPEELLVASIASCHMLWYLHLCADHGIVITHYNDPAIGIMITGQSGSGQFEKVILQPEVIVEKKEMIQVAIELHSKAHEMCFIANSVNFPININPSISSVEID